MNIPAQAPLHLLHRSPVGTLATHSREPQGFPYPTILPFAPDERHRPVILVSRLAEHTRNLEADPRAGFLVAHTLGDEDVLGGERVTIIGRFTPVEPEPALVRRYLRYHPEAERYLALGDFSFRVMQLERLRYIGGFGAMGWIEGNELDMLEPLAEQDELAALDCFARHPDRPADVELVGVDRFGVDLRQGKARFRCMFETAQADVTELLHSLSDCIVRHADWRFG